MIGYLKRHEEWGNKVLKEKDADIAEAIVYHRSVINFLEWERLAHCVVMLAVGIGGLIAAAFSVISSSFLLGIIAFILIVVFFFYIRHYFFLENGVQRLYELDRKMENKRGRVPLL